MSEPLTFKPRWATIKKNPVHLLAFGFGSGLLRPAPGTWGTLAGLLLFIPLNLLPDLLLLPLFVLAFVAGIWICGRTGRDLGVHDYGGIVWDEMVAIWLMLWLLPADLRRVAGLGGAYALAFVLFRIFDIWKPQPIRFFDRKLRNGLGVMLDDLLAALYGLALIYFINFFL